MTGTVLVIGGSGFVAGHCILLLLARGYQVRTTVRSLSRERDLRDQLSAGAAGNAGLDEHLSSAVPADPSRLEVVSADLTADDGWAAAVDGVDLVLHVASPVVPGRVRNEDDVIVPARDGALRVLRAAREAGVRRVVLTSAFHAVGFGHGRPDLVFTEDDWSPLQGPGMDAYGRSKVLAERAAWDFAAETADGPELVTLCPVAVVGPVLGDSVSGSNHVVQQILDGSMPGYPDLAIPFVDVRDVAAAHVAAATVTDAAGQRFLVAADGPAVALRDVGALFRRTLGEAAAKVPTRRIPSFVVRAAGRFSPEFRSVAADLGYVKRVSNERARAVLGITPRSADTALVECARSMVERHLAGPRSA